MPRQIFVDPDTGEPKKIFFEKRIEKDLRQEWEQLVTRHGGKVVKHPHHAEIVAISNESNRLRIQFGYSGSEDWRERRITVQFAQPFMDRCIEAKEFTLIEYPATAMGGRIGTRVEFTAADDEHLAKYLAGVMPDAEAGGRRGQLAYKTLSDLGKTNPRYTWAQRHTWHSWRNRYNKHKDRFDPKIEGYVKDMNPKRTQRYPTDRRLNRHGRFDSEEEEEEEEQEGEDDSQIPDHSRDDANEGRRDDDDDDDDDGQFQPPPDKGKGREASPADERDQSDAEEGRGQEGDATPPPRAGSDGQNDQEQMDEDEWQDFREFDEPHADVDAPPPSPQRRARFAAADSPGFGNIEQELRRQPSSSPRRRRPSPRQAPSKRPRLSNTSEASSSRSTATKGVHRPRGWRPGVVDSDDSDSDNSDADPDVAAHSLFSGSDVEGEDEEGRTTLINDPAQNVASATTSGVSLISHDKTLVVSASPTKNRTRLARLSSVSGQEQYIDVGTKLGEALPPKKMEVVVVDSDEDGEDHEVMVMDDDGEKEVIVIEDGDDADEIVEKQDVEEEYGGYDEHEEIMVEDARSPTPPPVVQTARNRRRKVEQAAAPPRVTRSRSQSVEPTHFASLPMQGTSKRKGKQKTKVIEPEVIEEEEISGPEADTETRSAQPETLADEADVLNIVTNSADYSGISKSASASHQESSNSGRNGSLELSSDDEQTLSRIAASKRKSDARETEPDTVVIKKRPRQSDAMLQAFKAQMGTQGPTGLAKRTQVEPFSSRLPATLTGAFAAAMKNVDGRGKTAFARQTATQRGERKPLKTAVATPTTTNRNVGLRSQTRNVSGQGPSSSEESAESYPAPGTKAKAYKKQLVEDEKHTPYTPPRGTGAAMHNLRKSEGKAGPSRRGFAT